MSVGVQYMEMRCKSSVGRDSSVTGDGRGCCPTDKSTIALVLALFRFGIVFAGSFRVRLVEGGEVHSSYSESLSSITGVCPGASE